ncbi:nucleotidyl transferase AbiEii/AbiGii toxin family protein [Phyllobacterium zundukense]|uniref:nucleotidyl transferase AbiEii/AbiGii toxin family protein n=1 Tax=Phyllobacterium zundukense TaxID=1867719 RepID=UPI00202B68EE|nr:nucleotidyl transferase AbiEii/AbiGii toxin family protein [Phyllobacterium zundukense]
MKVPKNIGVSVRDRLTQRARERRENAQLLMTRYAIERVLYRLSVSPYRDRFVLKGAMLFSLWAPVPYRATGDLDLLGFWGERSCCNRRHIC